jgi:ketosteroid isomerase-like protein
MPLSTEELVQAVRCRKTLLETLPKLDDSWLAAFNANDFAVANAYADAHAMLRDALEIDP